MVVLGQKDDHYDDGFHFPDQLPKPVEQILNKIFTWVDSDNATEVLVIGAPAASFIIGVYGLCKVFGGVAGSAIAAGMTFIACAGIFRK